MVPRYGISVGIALAITFGLLFVMQLFVASSRGDTESRHQLNWIEFVRVVRDSTPERTRDKPEKPPEPAERPDLPSTTTSSTGATVLPVAVTAPTFGDGVQAGGFGPAFADGEYLPLAKVMPRYPVRAQQDGVEGYAIVEYTVTTAGTTRDIRLIESSNPLFDRSCIEAAEKFRYRPRYVNGEAIEVPGVRNRCVYRLD
ncbi:MAG TPA: TonB family protein [Steroidobacter sp.]